MREVDEAVMLEIERLGRNAHRQQRTGTAQEQDTNLHGGVSVYDWSDLRYLIRARRSAS
jgi:hypothetical protein